MTEFVRRSFYRVGTATILSLTWLLVALLLVTGGASASDDLFLVAGKAVPENAADLRVLEQAASAVAAKAIPCTVGIRVGQNYGSGVVISENGLILTAAHVTSRPGRPAEIRFPDGTTVSGKTLGMNMEADGALIQITDEGKWPFAPLVTLDDYPRPGDWCVATGHPGGFDDKRSPPVRFGRLIDVNKYILRSDCTINSGDSGGPLFDIEGRVIGIHSRISEEATVNLHGPVLEFLESWSQMRGGKIYPKVPNSRFLEKLDADGDGSITRGEQPDDTRRRIYDRLVEKYNLDADAAHPIDDLVDKFEWRDIAARLEIRPYETSSKPGHSLPRERFIRGQSVRATFASLAKEVRKSIVEVRSDNKVVALGTVVPQGVLTKASQLTGEVVCKTHDGRELTATVAHTDAKHDLALLKLEENDLPAISWSDSTPAIGHWLVTPSLKAKPTSLGVVSVTGRKIEGAGAVLGVQIDPTNEGALIATVLDGSAAANAGLQRNDLITHILEQRVAGHKALQAALGKYAAGDKVKVRVVRDGKAIISDCVVGPKAEAEGGVLGVKIDPSTGGALVAKVFDGSGAASAGLKQNDLITHVFDQRVTGLEELKAKLRKYHAGDIVKTKVVRDGNETDFDIRLGMPEDIFIQDERFGSGKLNGELSLRRDDFPDVIQHDSVLEPNDVGGPVLDVSGKVVAINIARADRVATYAVPGRTIQEMLDKWSDPEPQESTE
ncbi:MAG: hypothetical protein CMJ64_03020 [Planctomycetaceae bacterium]|nr:hypothetical protein [Planctomycetaceae bacterium]